MLELTTVANISCDSEGRTISGVALPWEVEARTSTGQMVKFMRGSVSLKDVPVVLHHDTTRPIGLVVNESDGDKELSANARISQIPDGDQALVLASDGALRGFSVGVNPTEFEYEDGGEVLVVKASDTDHLALVVSPAFKESQITSVAASAAKPNTKEKKMAEENQETPAVVAAAPRTPVVQAGMPSIGEWMQVVTEQKQKPEQFAAMQARIQAATGHVVQSDFDSLTVYPMLGDLIDNAAPAARPLSEAVGVRQGPNSPSFYRPTMTGHLAAAAAAAEKTDVTDDGIATAAYQVDMTYIKRAANVSAEAQAFSTPDVYAIVGRDLVRSYLIGFDAAVATDLAGGTYDTITLAADGSDAVANLAAGANVKYGKVFQQPDLLVVAPDVWAKMVGWTATDGRQLFPVINPQNAAGTSGGIASWSISLPGLRTVVVPTLSQGQAYLMVSEFVEVYESSRIFMGPVQEPTVLGTAWGIGGGVGTFILDAAVSSVSISA